MFTMVEKIRIANISEDIDQPIERISFINGSPRLRHVFHTDALGSIVAISDDSGTTVQDYTYSALGEIQEQTGADMNRITYTARESLGDSFGFYYYRNRVLDSTTGRFISEDPWGFIGGINRYIYVKNNPLLFFDPMGLKEKDVWDAFKETIGCEEYQQIADDWQNRQEGYATVIEQFPSVIFPGTGNSHVDDIISLTWEFLWEKCGTDGPPKECK